MLAMLQPLFPGPWAPLAEALVCTATPPAEAWRVQDLLADAARLDDCLLRHARHLNAVDGDRRAVASSWCTAWLDVVLPPVVAAATVLHHVFPVHAGTLAVCIDGAGVPSSLHITDEGAHRPGTAAAVRFGPLIDGQLAPLFAALTARSGVAPKILWGNLARRLEAIFDLALERTGQAPHVASDRTALLESPLWPGDRPNPMHQPRRRTGARPDGAVVTLHRQCCLYYLLPGQDYCGACPLARRCRGPRACDPRGGVSE